MKRRKKMTRWIERDAKAMQRKSRKHQVRDLDGGLYEVTSGASGEAYTVNMCGGVTSCTCDWGKWTAVGEPTVCSHVLAVHRYLARQDGRMISAWSRESDAAKQKRIQEYLGQGVTVTKSLMKMYK